MSGSRLVPILIIAALFSGCGSSTVHHLGPYSPVDQWQEMNELADSAESRLTLVNGQQLLVRDVELHPDSTSFSDSDRNARLLISTDQIAGMLVLKRERSAGRAVKHGLITGGIFALLGYLGGGDHLGLRVRDEHEAFAGLLVGSTVGSAIGYFSGSRDSVVFQFDEVAREGELDGVPFPEMGQRVRVSTESFRVSGTLTEATSDRIGIYVRGQYRTFYIHRAEIERLEVHKGQKSNFKKIFGWTVSTFMVVGTVAGYSDAYFGRGETAAIGCGVGAVIGSGLGALFGAGSKRDIWQEVDDD